MTALVPAGRTTVSIWGKLMSEGQCRMCRRPWAVRAPTRHHLVPQHEFLRCGQTWSGPHELAPIPGEYRNALANIIGLCRPCHDRVDGRVDPTDRRNARRLLRRCLSQAEVSFVIAVRSKLYLDRHYPARAG